MSHELVFEESKQQVVRPLKLTTSYENRGWDIPTRYAVDGAGRCWADSAHGDALRPISEAELLAALESEGYEEQANGVRRLLGMEEASPAWMLEARKHGWTSYAESHVLSPELRKLVEALRDPRHFQHWLLRTDEAEMVTRTGKAFAIHESAARLILEEADREFPK